MTEVDDRIAGAIYGMAFGDSWGFPTEFMRHDAIAIVEPLTPRPLQITDDTQMSIYNSVALSRILRGEKDLSLLPTDQPQQIRVRKIFAEQHLNFEVDPDNGRAPGRTVMSALYTYRRSLQETGLEGGRTNDSKGCGTVMRAPWLGLVPLEREIVATLAVLQSETTHGHPQAALSSAVAALMLRDIASGELSAADSDVKDRLSSILYRVLGLAVEVGKIRSNLVSSEAFQYGIRELRESIYEALYGLESVDESELLDPSADICRWFGEGWIADEALLCAAASFAIYSGDPYGGIRRLVYSNGDSDSIAAIGGAFLGAQNGYAALEDQAQKKRVGIRGYFEPRYEQELASAISFFKSLQQS